MKLILSDFRVYQPRHERKLGDRSLQMISLEFLLKTGVSTLLFDGMISSEKGTRYVESVPFEIVTLEGYGDPRKATVTDEVCLQSCRLRSTNVWYQLGQPAEEYRRYDSYLSCTLNTDSRWVDFTSVSYGSLTLRSISLTTCATSRASPYGNFSISS